MMLSLSKLIETPGASVPFSTEVDLSDLCYGVSYPVTEPVCAEGMVRNTAGVLVMTGSIKTTSTEPATAAPMTSTGISTSPSMWFW